LKNKHTNVKALVRALTDTFTKFTTDAVSVPDRRHRYNCPPERIGDAVYLGVGLAELGVVDGAGEDEQTDAEGDQEEAESLEAGAERQQQDLETDRVFRQLEHPDEPNYAQKRQRRARLGANRAGFKGGREPRPQLNSALGANDRRCKRDHFLQNQDQDQRPRD